MRLASYRHGDRFVGAVLLGETLVDLGTAAQRGALAPDPGPVSVRTALERGWHRAERLREGAERAARDGQERRLDQVTLGPPVPDAGKVLCVGLNYVDHTQEVAFAPPEVPTIFAKFANSLVGPGADVRYPAGSKEVDYEGELAVVVGEVCKSVPVDRALDVVAGVMVLNDLSARDLQFATPQWTVGKAVDDFAPCGPSVVPLTDLPPIGTLRLTTRVNGVVVQSASTGEMVFGIQEIISFLSRTMTLHPGDIIATGTPAGVGMSQSPPRFLRVGDTVEVEIDGVGRIRNRIVPADAGAPAPPVRADRAATSPAEPAGGDGRPGDADGQSREGAKTA
jgi:2-keto-4-pentenoate hydratase/2-oxohepta-3-ene-1,7-dioic acid hydratase in catechol pathway